MIYLLDTNAISDLMRSESKLENWIAGLDDKDRSITCTVVRGEILFGIARLPEGKRRAELQESGYRFLNAFRCESLGESSANLYAEIKAARQRQGLSLDENDIWVAATALSLGAALVTRDDDFAGIPGLVVVATGRAQSH